MLSWTLCLVFTISCCAAPADNPVRVDLPVYDQSKIASDITLANPVEIENHPSPTKTKDNPIVGGFFTHNGIWENKLESSTPQIISNNYGSGLFSAPITTLEGALLETEGLGSKTLSVKENIQSVVADIFQPKPIVDTILEEEKYGNNGDKFYSAGKAIVNGASGVSDFINSILEVPGSILRKVTRAATEKLNYLGGKIIGL